jgi:hypothetical protein
MIAVELRDITTLLHGRNLQNNAFKPKLEDNWNCLQLRSRPKYETHQLVLSRCATVSSCVIGTCVWLIEYWLFSPLLLWKNVAQRYMLANCSNSETNFRMTQEYLRFPFASAYATRWHRWQWHEAGWSAHELAYRSEIILLCRFMRSHIRVQSCRLWKS